MTEDLIEKVARALFDAENEWRVMQDGLAGEVMDERSFKVTIVQWQMFARAALAAIEESGTHVVVLSEDIRELGSDLIEICDHHIASATALGRPDLAERLSIARAAISAGIGASPKVTP